MFIDVLNSQMSKYNTSSIRRGLRLNIEIFKTLCENVIKLFYLAIMSGASCPQSLIKRVKEAFANCENVLVSHTQESYSQVFYYLKSN